MKDWTADNWSAFASLATLGLTLAALLLSIIPIRQAKRVREDQAQPYVMAYVEPSEASNHLIDLVIKNFGTTGARM